MTHKNAEVIKAWADGKVIQWSNDNSFWEDFDNNKNWGPWDAEGVSYWWRVKKEPVIEVKYIPVGFNGSICHANGVYSVVPTIAYIEYDGGYASEYRVKGIIKILVNVETNEILSAEVVKETS